jgi:Zn-dependent M28 family amino/carboxypeptidase
MEVARAFAGMPAKPKRSLLFIAVTGEEAGLLGSDYFANHPTVDKAALIANINMDEDVMLWPLEDVVALGAEHSTLAGVVTRATRRMNLVASPDPQPEQVSFIRSDQYSFVRQGVPSFSLSAGFKSNDPSVDPAKIMAAWETNIYHHPQDDMQQAGLNFDAAALYARTALLCGWYAANDAAVPEWNPGDFFGQAFPRAPR